MQLSDVQTQIKLVVRSGLLPDGDAINESVRLWLEGLVQQNACDGREAKFAATEKMNTKLKELLKDLCDTAQLCCTPTKDEKPEVMRNYMEICYTQAIKSQDAYLELEVK